MSRIKYEDTTISALKSAEQIAKLVMKYGGTRFEWHMHPETRRLEGIRFSIHVKGQGDVPVRLTARTEKIEKMFQERSRQPWKDFSEKAERVAWRQLRDFVEQALFAVETGLFDLAAAFMAQVEVWDDDAEETITMAELVSRRASLQGGERGLLLLPRSTGVDR